jgi:hypothetical protein
MFTINLDVSEYDLLVINDLMRMFIIQLVVQVLYFLRHDKVELFSTVFLESTLFILLGIIIYWLLFNNILIFTNDKNKDKSDLGNYYQNVYSLK